MSDLSGKFSSVGTEIGTNHAELMEVLTSVVSALGGAPTDTFSDLLSAIGTTNSLLADIQSDMNTKLDSIFNTVDVMNNNASLNAQRLLAVMLQNACACDTTVPLLPPPLDTTPTELPIDEKCQRIQWFLDVFGSWVISSVVYLDEHDFIASFQIDNLLERVFEGTSFDGTGIRPIPIGIRDSLATALNGAGDPSAVNASVFDEITTGTVIADMRQALYAEDNAADGAPAAKAAAIASGGTYGNLIASMFYTNWANIIYSTEPVVDASDYDGSVCAPEGDLVVLTESCGDLINQVFVGTWNSGDRTNSGWTHYKLGAASAGSGTVKLFADGVEVLSLELNNEGKDATWIGSPVSVRVIGAMSADTYYHLQACTGTYGPGE